MLRAFATWQDPGAYELLRFVIARLVDDNTLHIVQGRKITSLAYMGLLSSAKYVVKILCLVVLILLERGFASTVAL